MAALYWFALIVGGGVLVASLLSGLTDGGGGHSAAAGHVDSGGLGDTGDGDAFKILSLRNLTYFLFGFGATGLALGLLGPLSGLLTAIAAFVVGVTAAGASATLLGYVGRTGSGTREGEDSFIGCAGRITLPFAAGSPGRVMVRRGHREYELRARAFDGAARGASIGTEIVVVEMSGGTALVTPLEESPPLLGTDA
jgi:membrane protein implicated in regulation of membrane protease activity